MEHENELKELKRRRSQLLEEIDVLEKEAEEDKKRIKVASAPLPPGKWRKLPDPDLLQPEDTVLLGLLDMVRAVANYHAIAASEVASAAAIAARAASVAQDLAQAVPLVHTATGPQADAVQAAAFAVAAEIVKLATSAASAAAVAKSLTETAAFGQDTLATTLGRNLAAALAATAATAPRATAAAPQAPVGVEEEEEEVLDLKP